MCFPPSCSIQFRPRGVAALTAGAGALRVHVTGSGAGLCRWAAGTDGGFDSRRLTGSHTQTSWKLTAAVTLTSLWIYYWTQQPLGCAIWLLKKPVEIIHQKGSSVLLVFFCCFCFFNAICSFFLMRTLHQFLRLFDGRKTCKCFNVDIIFISLMFLPRCHVDKCIFYSCFTAHWCKLTPVQRSANVQLKLTYAS